ncbi:hypothetical protein [uncultured Williamsia sp.]|uniref:hypothetical protein n=1 Tax=uncultured Williamsia sp. TaxID=259311 RepID=UPI002638CAF9|nr:hypothetical protein [uncultured Williamsia sp.]
MQGFSGGRVAALYPSGREPFPIVTSHNRDLLAGQSLDERLTHHFVGQRRLDQNAFGRCVEQFPSRDVVGIEAQQRAKGTRNRPVRETLCGRPIEYDTGGPKVLVQ